MDTKRKITISGKCPKCEEIHHYEGIGAVGAILKGHKGQEFETTGFCIGLSREEMEACLFSIFESSFRNAPDLFMLALARFGAESGIMQLVAVDNRPPTPDKDKIVN